MKGRLKAFTLIELLVAMVVSSAVIASSYFVYDTFSKSLVDYRRLSNNLSDAAVFNGILSHDMGLSGAVRKGSSNDILLEQANESIRYEWKEDAILRITEGSIDTFHLAVRNAETNFMNNEQAVSGGLIDEFQIVAMSDERELIFSFEKKYGSDILVESEKNSYGGY